MPLLHPCICSTSEVGIYKCWPWHLCFQFCSPIPLHRKAAIPSWLTSVPFSLPRSSSGRVSRPSRRSTWCLCRRCSWLSSHRSYTPWPCRTQRRVLSTYYGQTGVSVHSLTASMSFLWIYFVRAYVVLLCHLYEGFTKFNLKNITVNIEISVTV